MGKLARSPNTMPPAPQPRHSAISAPERRPAFSNEALASCRHMRQHEKLHGILRMSCLRSSRGGSFRELTDSNGTVAKPSGTATGVGRYMPMMTDALIALSCIPSLVCENKGFRWAGRADRTPLPTSDAVCYSPSGARPVSRIRSCPGILRHAVRSFVVQFWRPPYTHVHLRLR